MVVQEKSYITTVAKKTLQRIDYSDTFSTTNHTHSLEEISYLVFDNFPRWVNALMGIRTAIVKLFGIESKLPSDYRADFQTGSYVGIFKILEIRNEEIIFGANEDHLKFRASLINTKELKNNIKLTTIVEYNNRFGKVYMTLIKPFHKLVLRSILKKAFVSNKIRLDKEIMFV